MKNKKYLFGGIVTAMTLSAVMVFNILVYPHVLAETLENPEVTIENSMSLIETDEQQGNTDLPYSDDTDIVPDPNAISKEVAIEIATKKIKENIEISVNIDNFSCKAVYATSPEPLNKNRWVVAFYEENEGFIQSYSVMINAMTGEITGYVSRLTDPRIIFDDYFWYEEYDNSSEYEMADIYIFDSYGVLVVFTMMTEEEYDNVQIHMSSNYIREFIDKYKAD